MNYNDFLELCARVPHSTEEKYNLFPSIRDSKFFEKIKTCIWNLRRCVMLDSADNIISTALPTKSLLLSARKSRRSKQKWAIKRITFQGQTIKLDPLLRDISPEEKTVQELLGMFAHPATRNVSASTEDVELPNNMKNSRERLFPKAARSSASQASAVKNDIKAMIY